MRSRAFFRVNFARTIQPQRGQHQQHHWKECYAPTLQKNTVMKKSYFSTKPSSSSLPPVDDGAGQPGLFVGHGGVHDVGGLDSLLGQTVDLSDPTLQDWEQETHALLIALVKSGYLTTDELRRNIEAMQDAHYIERTYYCKWATSIALSLIERGVVSYTELDQALLGSSTDKTATAATRTNNDPKYSVGQRVRVKSEQSMARWRKPHLRTPGYIFGVSGIVDSFEGNFPDPSFKAFRSMFANHNQRVNNEAPTENLYRVRFQQNDVWPEGARLQKHQKEISDTITVEIYENWLEEIGSGSSNQGGASPSWEIDPSSVIQDNHSPAGAHSHQHHHHGEEDGHDHKHVSRAELEQTAVDLELSSARLCSSGSLNSLGTSTTVVGDRLSAALIALLEDPIRLGSDLRMELRRIVDAMESVKVRADGATLVVRAWNDPSFEERLLDDAAAAASEMGINTVNATAPTKLKVVKSELPTDTKPGVHNLITCTLCSCYPLSLLGLSPKWYKSRTFRARAVREPRAMLRDSFGLNLLPDKWTIRVHDSTADLRYLVLPPRPPGTEAWTDEALRQLVTRDTMIGVALPDGINTKE